MITRRTLITDLVALVAAPAVVRASSLDLVRGRKLHPFCGARLHHVTFLGPPFDARMFIDDYEVFSAPAAHISTAPAYKVLREDYWLSTNAMLQILKEFEEVGGELLGRHPNPIAA
jgi:hypothetical protein